MGTVRAFLSVVLLSLSSMLAAETTFIAHDIHLAFDADSGHISVNDTLALPHNLQTRQFEFALDSHFKVRLDDKLLNPSHRSDDHSYYQVPAKATLALSYTATLATQQTCDWLLDVCLKADSEGLFLGSDSAWHPRHATAAVTSSISADLPEGWSSVSQGLQNDSGVWRESLPQQSMTFMAAPYHVYASTQQGIEAQVYLRHENKPLAQRYLDSTHRHLQRYSTLFGDYPYAKFATVESFWQTGWGLPSMTLLGGHVMRLPFILETSLPHEILHSWWGNGVYVDSSQGNWSEGLTSYLSDHAYRVQEQQGPQYRRDQLQQFSTFVTTDKQTPLAQFTSRYDRASQAIGYGQSMMLFHEIRQWVGEPVFIQKLKGFFGEYQFRSASFDNLLQALLDDPRDLANFKARLYALGAVEISASLTRYDVDEHSVVLSIKRSGGHEQSLRLPIRIRFIEGEEQLRWLKIHAPENTQQWSFDQPVCSLSVDPYFDVFRQLLKGEAPATLKVLQQPQSEGWQIKGQGDHHYLGQMFDLRSSELGATLWAGKWDSLPESAKAQILALSDELFRQSLENAQTIKVASVRVNDRPFVWVSAIESEVVVPLFRKLRHYGKYSYLVFNQHLVNTLKGQWPAVSSPLQLYTGVCQ